MVRRAVRRSCVSGGRADPRRRGGGAVSWLSAPALWRGATALVRWRAFVLPLGVRVCYLRGRGRAPDVTSCVLRERVLRERGIPSRTGTSSYRETNAA